MKVKPIKVKVKVQDLEIQVKTIKIPKADLILLQKNAKLFAKGKLSVWLRYAGLNFIPEKAELPIPTIYHVQRLKAAKNKK